MLVCTFFGHRECCGLDTIVLRNAIEDLIKQGVDTFYVGHHGDFDSMVRSLLKQLQNQHSHIRYAVVLAYMPGEKNEYDDFSDTMLPEGIESVHPKYAIDWRNRWMLRQSQYVIAYIHHHWGGAARYVQTAVKQGKTVINLYSKCT